MKSVFIFDETRGLSDRLKTCTSSQHIKFFSAFNLIEFQNILKCNDLDLVILNVYSCHKPISDIFQYVKQLDVGIPTVVLSADFNYTTLEDCLSTGAFFIMRKNSESEELLKNFAEMIKCS